MMDAFLVTPDERDRLTRLETMVDTDRENTNARFSMHHERANQLQKDYLDFDRRLRVLENFALTSRINWSWLVALSTAIAALASSIVSYLVRRIFG